MNIVQNKYKNSGYRLKKLLAYLISQNFPSIFDFEVI